MTFYEAHNHLTAGWPLPGPRQALGNDRVIELDASTGALRRTVAGPGTATGRS